MKLVDPKELGFIYFKYYKMDDTRKIWGSLCCYTY